MIDDLIPILQKILACRRGFMPAGPALVNQQYVHRDLPGTRREAGMAPAFGKG